MGSGSAERGGGRFVVLCPDPPPSRALAIFAQQQGPAPRLSAKRAVGGDLIEGALEHRELLIVQPRDEQIEDPAQMHRGGFDQAGHARVGQDDHDATCVVVSGSSTNEAFIDEPGDPAGQA